jgi:hypothetical protein
MPNILVLANQTLGGTSLLEAVRHKAQAGDARFFVVVPQNRPRHGNVVYDEAVRDAAQLRVDLALSFMREQGIHGQGEVGDPDPFNAAMDAIPLYGVDEVLVSTLPVTSSGWLRRDLVERLRDASGLPVEHVVVDPDAEGGFPFALTLVAANLTVAADELVRGLKAKADERPSRFIVVVPQDSGDGRAAAAARERLRSLLDSLEGTGIVVAGTIGDPDPYTAIMNALQFFSVTDIVISTLPEASSKWLAENLVERVQRASGKPVEHIVSTPAPAGA